MKKIFLLFGFSLSLGLSAQEAKDVSLTVYNEGTSMVRETRDLQLKEGVSWVKIRGVPSQIDATTVSLFSPKKDGSISVLEQNYLYDLVSQSKLLEKYIDKTIYLDQTDKNIKTGESKTTRVEATLLSTQGGIIVKIGDEVHTNPRGRIVLPELSEGLLTKPTLKWKVDSDVEGMTPTRIRYMTGGMSWKADYNMIISKDGSLTDVSSWISLTNNSGATFNEAKIKLIAGDVNRVQKYYKKYNKMRDGHGGGNRAVTEKSFSDYHLYELPGRTTLLASQLKQVEFMNRQKVPSSRIYRYHVGTEKVSTHLVFKNDDASNMGIPLPKGKIRMYQRDEDDGQLEFIGEDLIDHTPKDEELTLTIGNAFDLVGETVVTDRHSDSDRRVSRASYKVTVKNRKEEAATIEVRFHVGPKGNWELTKKSFEEYEYKDGWITVPVTLKPGEVSELTYSLRRTW